MNKVLQRRVNTNSVKIFNTAMREYYAEQCKNGTVTKGKRLRSCSARVYETENFFLLQSYSTMIAAIRKRDWVCVNVMRHEYDFSDCTGATSTQHFYKFVKDYVPCVKLVTIYTYMEV